jgi:hypothetical protein
MPRNQACNQVVLPFTERSGFFRSVFCHDDALVAAYAALEEEQVLAAEAASRDDDGSDGYGDGAGFKRAWFALQAALRSTLAAAASGEAERARHRAQAAQLIAVLAEVRELEPHQAEYLAALAQQGRQLPYYFSLPAACAFSSAVAAAALQMTMCCWPRSPNMKTPRCARIEPNFCSALLTFASALCVVLRMCTSCSIP